MTIDIKFHGVDWWGRAVYKVQDINVYIGSVETLFSGPKSAKENVDKYFKDHLDELVIFGSTFDEDDPLGTNLKKDIKINII